MAVTLETLVLDFKADFTAFDRQLQMATQKAAQTARKIENTRIKLNTSDLDKFCDKLDKIESKWDSLIKKFGKGGDFDLGVTAPTSPRTPSSGGGGAVNIKIEDFTQPIVTEVRQLRLTFQSQIDKLNATTKDVVKANKALEVKSFGAIFKESLSKNLAGSINRATASPFKNLNIGKGLQSVLRTEFTGFINKLTTSFAIDLEVEEGATRLSDALKRGLDEGITEAVMSIRAELLEGFGVVRGDSVTPTQGRGSKKAISEITGANRDVQLVQNEIDNAVKSFKQLDKELEFLTQTVKFQSVANKKKTLADQKSQMSSKIADLDIPAMPLDNVTEDDISRFDQEMKVYNQKKAQLQGQIKRLDTQIESLDQTDIMRQVEELKAQKQDLNSEANRLQQQLKVYQNTALLKRDDLKKLSYRQLTTALRNLARELQTSGNTSEDVKLLNQIKKITELEKKSADVIRKQKLALESAQQDKSGASDGLIAAKRKELARSTVDLKSLGQQKSDLVGQAESSGAFERRDLTQKLDAEFRQVEKELQKRAKRVPKMVGELSSVIGINLSNLDDFPTILGRAASEIGRDGMTANASYLSTSNEIAMSKKLYAEAFKDVSNANLKAIETLSHELTHAVQFNYGKDTKAVLAGLKKPKLVNDLTKLTKEELLAVGSKVMAYKRAGESAVSQLTEIDAFVTGMRAKAKALAMKKVGNTGNAIKGTIDQARKMAVDIKKAALDAMKGGASDADVRAILDYREVVNTATTKLINFQALEGTQGLLDPQGFIKDFETELQKVAQIRKAVKEAVEKAKKGQIVDVDVEAATQKVEKRSKLKETKETLMTLSNIMKSLNTAVKGANKPLSRFAKEIEKVAKAAQQETGSPFIVPTTQQPEFEMSTIQAEEVSIKDESIDKLSKAVANPFKNIPLAPEPTSVSEASTSTTSSTITPEIAHQELAKKSKLASNAATSFADQLKDAKKALMPLKELKGLSPAQLKHFGKRDIQSLQRLGEQANIALIAAKADNDASAKISLQKAQIARMLSARVKAMQKIEPNFKAESVTSLQEVKTKMKAPDTSIIGGDYKDGFENELKDSTAVHKAADEYGKASIKGLKKGIDSASPSKKTRQEGNNWVDGLVNAINARVGDAVFAARLVGRKSVEALSDVLDYDLTALGQTGASIGERLGMTGSYIQGLVNPKAGQSSTSSQQMSQTDILLSATTNMEKAEKAMQRLNNKFTVTGSQAEAFGEDAGNAARVAVDELRNMLSTTTGLNTPLSKLFKGFAQGFQGTGRQARKLQSELLALGTAGILLSFRQQITQTVVDLLQFQLQVEATQRKLQAIGMSEGINLFKEFGDAASSAGVQVTEFASQYAGMTASLKNKVLDPRGLFEGLATGMAGRGVTGEAQGRALTALSQMASKGVVSMEELRQQLGEALPGALSIAADAMGVTQQQFIGMVSSGQVLAADFLPKFADQLNATGTEVTGVAKEFATFQNLVGELKFNLSEMLQFENSLKAQNQLLRMVNAVAKPLFVTLGVFGAAMVANLTVQMVKLVMGVKLLSGAVAFASSVFLPMIGIVAGLYAGFQAFNMITNAAAKPVKNLNKELKALQSTMKEGKGVNDSYNASSPLAFTKNAKLKEKLAIREGIEDTLDTLVNIDIEARMTVSEDAISAKMTELQPKLDRIDELTEKIAKRNIFGLSIVEVREMQTEVAKLQKEIDKDIEMEFDQDKIMQGIKVLDQLKDVVQGELNKGVDRSELQVVIDEIEVREESLRKLSNRINSIQTKVNVTLESAKTSDALQANIDDNLGLEKLKEEEAIFRALADSKSHERMAEIKAREQAVFLRKQELALVDAASQAAQKTLSSLSSVQMEELSLLLGGKDPLGDISGIDLSKAQANLAEQGKRGNIEDPAVTAALKALGDLHTNTKRVAQVKVEEARTAFEAVKALRELKLEIEDLNISRLRQALDADRLNSQVERMFGDNDQLNNLKQERLQTERSLTEGMIQQERAFADMVRGIDDFAQGLKDSTVSLKQTLVKMGRDMYLAAVNSVSGFMSAAGLEDILGLDQIRGMVGKAVNITSSDQRPQMQQQMAVDRRNFDRQTRDQVRQQQDLNRSIGSAISDLQNQQSQLQRTRKINIEDMEFDMDGMMLQVMEMQQSANRLNRQIEGANLEAQSRDVNKRIPQLQITLPNLNELDTAPERILAQMDSVYAQIEQAQNETMAFYREIGVKGNQEISRAMSDARAAFNDNMSVQRQQIQMEGKRIAQANALLAREIEGAMFALNRRIEAQVGELAKRAVDARQSVMDLFTGLGIPAGYNEQLELRLDQVATDIDGQATQLKQAKEALEKVVEIYGNEGSPDALLKAIQEGSDIGAIDANVRGVLMKGIKEATSDEDFAKVIDKSQELIRTYGGQLAKLKGSREMLIANAAELFDRDNRRMLEDLDLQIEQASLDKLPFLDEPQRLQMQLELDINQADIDLQRKVEDMLQQGVAPEVVAEVRRRIETLNEIKFDKLRKEASMSFRYLQDIAGAFGSGIESLITGFGDAIFGRDKEAMDKAKADAMIEHAEKLQEAREKFAGDPEQFAQVAENLELINNAKMDRIQSEFSVLGNMFGLLKNVVVDFTKTIVQSFAKIAAQRMVMGLFGGLFGGFGGNFMGFGGGGVVPNFSQGGTVGEFGKSLDRAMTLEGAGAVPIVAHKGEQVLTTRNGDAQFFRALQKSGEWESMKRIKQVPNFKQGGMVGGGSTSSMPSRRGFRGGDTNVKVITNYNIATNDVTSFRKSESQIRAQNSSRNKREYDRNR